MSGGRTSLFKYAVLFFAPTIILSFVSTQFGAAQGELAGIRFVRTIETERFGVPHPAGLTFVEDAGAFNITNAPRPSDAPPEGTDFILLTAIEELFGSARIESVDTDPVNTAFDNKYNRLLILQPRLSQLVLVDTTRNGRLDPNTERILDARHFGLQSPNGMAVDPASGRLFILDVSAGQVVIVDPDSNGNFEGALISRLDLRLESMPDARGLALDPTNANLHVLSASEQTLYELDAAGQIVASRDLSSFDLVHPQGLVFAPSGDRTDDPAALNLYVADSDNGRLLELALQPVSGTASAPRLAPLVSSNAVSNLVQIIDTSAFTPPSPDSAGLTYLAGSDTLLMSDSEVNEMPIFAGVNLWEMQSDGNVVDTTATTGFSNEPTGAAYNPMNGHVFISDDNSKEIFEIDPGLDGRYGTPDDTVTSFDTLVFNSGDPEGLTFDTWAGVLFIGDGVNAEVYRVHPGANGVFDGVAPAGDDQVTSFDTAVYGLRDPEGIAFNTDTGNLYIVGNPNNVLLEVTTAGAFVQSIDISAANAGNAAGLAYAPGSLDPGAMNIYIADRAVDNNSDPNENDGKIYEMTLPPPAAVVDLSMSKTVDNPTPDVGADVVFTLTAINLGPSDATGVEVFDLLPSGYTYVSDDGVGAYDPASGIWSLGALANGASATLHITAMVNLSGFFTNTAQVSTTNESDSNPNNNQASASTFPKLADLSVEKSVDNANPEVGGFVVFTVKVTNGGPSNATGVAVSDLLPSGYTYVSDDVVGAYDATSGVWTVGALAKGAAATLKLTAAVNASGDYTNVASISAANESDPDPSNNQDSASTIPVAVAHLSIAKGVDTLNPNQGDFVVFTLTVGNSGPSDASGVVVTDLLPSGYTYVSDDAMGAYDAPSGQWSVGALANGASAKLNITATVNSSGDYTNLAQISASNEIDPNAANDQASVSTFPGATVADLSLEKIVDNPAPVVGGTVVFTVTVTNLGPSDATGVVVSDPLPSGYTYVLDDGGGAYDALSGNWTIGTVLNSASAVLNITATLNASGDYTNTAQLSASNEVDPDATNDVASASAAPAGSADLSLVKSVNEPAPAVGDSAVFTLTVTNLGPSDATGVAVTDLLPSGYTYVSDSSMGAYDAPSGLWTIGALTNGASAMLNITTTVNATGDYDNLAQISSSNEPDPSPTNDQSMASTTPAPVADLSMVKSVDDPTPDVSANVVFTVTVANSGPSDATGVAVSDLLPSGYTYVSDDGAGAYEAISGIWTVGAIANGASATLHITAMVNAAGDYSNVAQIAASDATDPDDTNDQASASTTPNPIADLSIAKSVDNSTPDVDTFVVFTLTASNLGPSDASGVVVNDQLPSGYTYVSDDGGGTYDALNGQWAVGALLNGASATLQVTAEVNASGDYTNVAQITASIETDPNATNDLASASTTPNAVADLLMTKSVDVASPNVGENVTFTLEVTNLGPSDASGIAVSDPLPSGYTYVSDDGLGAYDVPSGLWTIGAITSGSSATLHITATVNASGDYTNVAQISASTEIDPNPANDQASVSTTPGAVADLAVSKTVDNPTPDAGTNVVFTLTTENLGPSDATGVAVSDPLPSGYTYVSDDGGVAYNEANGLWTIGDLANGASVTLNITATVNGAGDFINVAQIFASNEPDPDATNDQASASTTPGAVADLAASKTVDNATPDAGTNVVFTLTAENLGPSDATGVVVSDLLPSGYTYVSDDGGAAYDEASGLWTIGNLVNGASVTLNITASVNGAGDFTNVAQIFASNEPDPDATNDQASASTTPGAVADLAVSKTVDNPTPDAGTNVVFTLNVENLGPSDTTGVVVSDPLPSGYTYVSDDGGVAYNEANGSWIIGDLANGASTTLNITATVNGAGDFTNVAEIFSSNEPDPDATNDQASASTTPDAVADLAVFKTVDILIPDVGTNVVFSLTASNLGPSDATGVVVSDLLPSGYTYVSDDGGAAYDEASGLWTIGNLVNGASVTLNITATVGGAGEFTNIAQISSSEPDPNSSNNVSSVSTSPDPPPQCTTPNQDLSGETVTGSVTVIACSITAGNGYTIADTGDVTFSAKGGIQLRNGFSVLTGGRFVAEIDPTIP